ncbi:arsenate reductase (glutaredoxin) [Noviherbaspirillum sp. ST9]|uniref:arsenate reductase (glutaredoxin) n=1 Tax=Noviherbaspirillum sp. ST9 TaxID=3401606 RepID=UPI003B5866C6
MITIYHNPRCSKSREALALVEAFAVRKQIPVNVVEYLTSPPSLAELEALQVMLGCAPSEMVRGNEEEFAALGLAHAADADLLRAIAAHPKLLQRPIVVFGRRAVIGRPPELVSGLLED